MQESRKPSHGEAEEAVATLLKYLGEDPARDGLKDTPRRVVKAWTEMCGGYDQDPAQILTRSFLVQDYDQVIISSWIEFHSTCEHHLLPFSGYAHVAYLPNQNSPVVGLSKLARLVDCFAKRLQIQERLTEEIARAMDTVLAPAGIAVIIQAKHLCMGCRGVKKHNAVMTTSSMHGVFRTNGPARMELMHLIKMAKACNE